MSQSNNILPILVLDIEFIVVTDPNDLAIGFNSLTSRAWHGGWVATGIESQNLSIWRPRDDLKECVECCCQFQAVSLNHRFLNNLHQAVLQGQRFPMHSGCVKPCSPCSPGACTCMIPGRGGSFSAFLLRNRVLSFICIEHVTVRRPQRDSTATTPHLPV